MQGKSGKAYSCREQRLQWFAVQGLRGCVLAKLHIVDYAGTDVPYRFYIVERGGPAPPQTLSSASVMHFLTKQRLTFATHSAKPDRES